jgi:hypothetical protein
MRTMLVNPRHTYAAAPIAKGGRISKMAVYVRNPSTLVRPRLRRVAAPARRRRANPVLLANPRRRRRHYAANPVLMANPRRRHRRRAANPLILPNRRRRARRHNPVGSMKAVLMTSLSGVGAGAAAYAVNKFGISKLVTAAETAGATVTVGGVAMRGGARLALGLLGAYLMPGQFSAALMGAMAYPIMSELDVLYNIQTGASTTATSGGTPAATSDLEAMLDGID